MNFDRSGTPVVLYTKQQTKTKGVIKLFQSEKSLSMHFDDKENLITIHESCEINGVVNILSDQYKKGQ